MKPNFKCSALIAFLLMLAHAGTSQDVAKNDKTLNTNEMKTYVIEREIPGAGKLTETELRNISQKSNAVLKDMGPRIEWVHSYVTGNKIYCIYKAENETLVKEHAKRGGFPANSIQQVGTLINPATGN